MTGQIEMLRAWNVGGLVFVTALQRGRGKGSGVRVESEVTFVFTVRQRAIARWQMLGSEREALDAMNVDE